MDTLITMTGNVGSDVELRDTKNGTPWAHFRVACTPRSLRDGTWVDEETIWATVHCWRRIAANAKASIRCGDAVIVTGRLRRDSWTNDKGETRENWTIQATCVGHDFTNGTSYWHRNTSNRPSDPASPAEPSEPAPEPTEDDSESDAQTFTREEVGWVHKETGEILETAPVSA